MNSMRDAEIHWAVLKRFPVQYSDGSTVMHEPGDFLHVDPDALRPRALEQMREAGKIAPVTIPSDEWLLGEATRRGLVDGGDGSGVAAVSAPLSAEDDDDGGLDDDEDVVGVPAVVSEGSFPLHTGGQNYELSDGSVIRGRRAAQAAQRALDTLVEA